MSADNWTYCPKCHVDPSESQAKRRDKAIAQYGKVSAEQYAEILKSLTEPLPPVTETLREDYEIGIHSGEFAVSYAGSCDKCGFSFKYKFSKRVN